MADDNPKMMSGDEFRAMALKAMERLDDGTIADNIEHMGIPPVSLAEVMQPLILEQAALHGLDPAEKLKVLKVAGDVIIVSLYLGYEMGLNARPDQT